MAASVTASARDEGRGLAASSAAAMFSAVILTTIGLVFTHAASRPGSLDPTAWYLLPVTKQALAASLGFAVMIALSRTTYDRLYAASWPLLWVTLVMLGLVWAPGIAAPTGEVHRRLGYGALTIQPSELAKISVVLYLAAYCSRGAQWRGDTLGGLAVPLGTIGLVCIAIEREPDLGTALVVFLGGVSLLYAAGASHRYLIGFSALGVGAVLLVVLIGHVFGVSYRLGRLPAWWAPEQYATGIGYQIVHSLISVSKGGLTGVGFGQGEGRFYLPASNTDYAMATVTEEFGIFGLGAVLLLIGVIVAHAHRVATRSRDPFARLVACGLGAMIMWQAVLNVAVVTNAIPCTGVPMPFISYGTSSLVVMLASVGILMRPETRRLMATP